MKKLYTSLVEKSTILLCVLFSITLAAQKGTVSGTISDDSGPLIGATVLIKGTSVGTTTDLDGSYSLAASAGSYTIEASFIGYSSQEIQVSVTTGADTKADFVLSAGISFDEIVVTGTRAVNRTNTDSPVPVDVINISKLSGAAPQTNLNQLLHFTAPSFSSNTQTISDGTDHIDPASLRGLGPDQVLVLINGKRRHTTSLVNVNGTFGRGAVGTDLNAIPATAIEKIEVLRDGAAAQYGSDAIAGVINLRLKETVNQLGISINTGGNFTSEIGAFEGKKKSVDGEVVDLGVNYGLPLGNKGGFINVTGQFNYRGSSNRMKEYDGSVYNALNSIERIGAGSGLDVSKLTEVQIKAFAQQVSHFSSDLKSKIANASSTSVLRGLLGTDVTAAELTARGQALSDFNMQVGQSQTREGKLFANVSIPLGEDLELYGFGGSSYRSGISGCFYRLPNQDRTTTSIYPNGTVPKINSNITDNSLAAGMRGKIGDWNLDFSNVVGQNKFLYHMTDTHNATIGSSSPTEFDAGGHSFSQSTSNFDISQYFESGGIKGLNVAFGAEYRFENFKVIPGTEQSYGNYDVNGLLVTPITPSDQLSKDLLGRNRPAGAQCFAGFLPTNEVDANRSSAAAYVDLEADISEAFLLGAAFRFENYSDFGSTFNYKLASRYKLSNNFSLRGAISSGFRAPSLHQIHYSRTSTIFTLVNGLSVPTEVGVFSNTSRAAKLLGIPQLKEETSNSFSLGFTAKVPESGLRFTVDAYMVNINNRVVLTGQFSPGSDAELKSIFEQAGAQSATFFANAIDTKSKGLDIVIAHNWSFGSGKSLDNDLAATFSQTKWDQDAGIKASDLLRNKGLVDTYFGQESRIYLEQAVPRTKLTLSNTLNLNKLSVYLRNTYFGETTEATTAGIFDSELNLSPNATIDPYNSGKVITDLSVGYGFNENLRLTVGANNLLDVYPDVSDPSFTSGGRFIYSRRSPQFSYNGRHMFARLAFTLK